MARREGKKKEKKKKNREGEKKKKKEKKKKGGGRRRWRNSRGNRTAKKSFSVVGLVDHRMSAADAPSSQISAIRWRR